MAIRYTSDGVTTGLLQYVPALDYIESRFHVPNGILYLQNYWWVSVIGSVLYLIMVFGGSKIMESRKPYSLTRPLVLWNFGLAVFSVFGTLSIIPPLVHGIYLHGFTFSLCYADTVNHPHQSIWGLIFILSKIFEFGDTVFLVLRKKPIIFLHWYHHVTVCVYSFYMCSGVTPDISRWFGGMNYVVHSIMYTYYTLRALRYNVPSRVAFYITLLQLSQMFVGIFINVSAYRLYLQGLECGMKPWFFYFGMCIYGSYAILFLHLFLTRYVYKGKRKSE